MNTSPRPQDDFFTYVNGKWIEENPIPADEARWGSFNILRVTVEKQLKEIFEGLEQMADGQLDENARKVRDFYRTGMDVEKLQNLNTTPLKEFFDRIDAATTTDELVSLLGFLHRRGVGGFWEIGVDQDQKQTDIMAFYMGQGGLSLPDRDYYLNDDEKSKEIRTKYLKYIDDMFTLAPDVRGVATAQMFSDIETRFAKASMTRVEMRDPEPMYNKMTPAELAAITPGIDWQRYFAAMEMPMPAYMIVRQPEFMKEAAKMLTEIPLEHLKAHLRWFVYNGGANYLSENFVQAFFDFYGRTFSGATEMKPRWRRVLGVVNGMLDDLVGQLYVKKHFSEDAKAKVTALVDHLVVAYRARIEQVPWMGPKTKAKAFEKLSAFSKKLGYPDKWKDMSALVITPDSFFANFVNAHIFEFDRQMKKIGHPPDRTEWYMSPQTVNACYNPVMNEVLFPAAILQAPFFDPAASDASNFGGIGAVIGHELTHGFDDEGGQYDAQGNLNNWWSKEDKEQFEKLGARLAAQFDAYEPLPGLYVNGKLTLGENIADLGGLLIAYDGMMLSEKESGVVDPDAAKDFFTNLAVCERNIFREEALRTAIQIDPHSPGIYRVNGPLSNMSEFYAAFDVKPGDKLYRKEEDRVKIW